MKRGKMRRFLSALLCAFLALGSLTFTVGAGADEYEELRYGMENDAVRAMQTRLNQLGYTVSPSGGYYDNTKNAVAAFQQAMGFAINGKVASPDVQAALFSSDAPTASGGVWQPASATPEPTSVPATATSATLSYGMTNSDAVLMMQKRLNTLGFMKGTSGNYWKETQKAMAAFLQAAGISGDGSVATPEMLQMLYSADAPTAYTTTTPPANNNAGGSSEATPTPPPANDAPITMLTYGMENNASVKRMQTRLRELGFFNSNPTGNYYGVTESAVEAFQKAAGLYVDGKRASVEMQDLLYSGSAPSAYSSMATYSELRLNMMNNDQVRLMQRRLAALGYFNVQYVTGNYMTLTSRAVADFQSAAGLPVNGNVATTATLEALYANSAPSKGSSATNPTPADATPTPAPAALYSDLVFGAQGSAVKTMQKRLKELGYLNDTADGIYGKNTAAAVSAFQVNAKLPQNGNYASAEMQQALYAGTAPRVDGTVATTPPAGATPTPTPAPTAIAYTDLTYGMVNNSLVKAMQDKLRELGYFSETSTGNYYTQTRRAVTAYEKARGVTSDGRSVSAALLQTILGASAATATPTPTPAPTPVSYQTLTYGMENNSLIRSMQNRLKELGYFSGDATGNYYNATKTAVAAFEKACGNTVDGKTASVSMLQTLFSDSAPKAGASNGVSDKYATLTYGMTMYQSVLNAQRRLVELGFMSSGITANYDDNTAEGVKAFQTYFGFAVNGNVLTGEQQELLFTSGTKEELLAIRQNNSGSSSNSGTSTNDYSKANLSATLNKGSSGTQVTLLTTRLIELGYLSGSPVSYYSDAVVNAVKWFQNSNSLDPDGIAGKNTLTKIYTQTVLNAAGSQQAKPDIVPTETSGTSDKPTVSGVQSLSWSNETYFNRKTGIFKDGATATVTDVKTGITYKVKRRGGYNHADVEPLTAYDTWQMYRIYNQKWAWDRRAVIVTFSNGVSSAASINGMPHGESSITDNNMDGHTCIHFTGSMTHGTSKVDEGHQSAIAEAAQTNLSELQEKINAQQ